MNSKSLKSTLAVAALGWTSTASAAAWGTVAYGKGEIPTLGCGACLLAGLSYTSNTADAWKVYADFSSTGYSQTTTGLQLPSKNPQTNYDCASSYFNSQVTKLGSGFDPAVHSWTVAPSVNNYFLLAQCPFVTSACAGAAINPTTFAITTGAGKRYTEYAAAAAGLAFEVPLATVPVGTACTYIVGAKGAFPTIQFLPSVGSPSLYVQILEFDAGQVSTVAASGVSADGQVPAAGQPADLFLGADWGGVSGRAGVRGDWAPWVQFVADPKGSKTPALRNVFPEDVERQVSLYRQRASAYTASANTYKALWLDWSQGLTTIAMALGLAPADGSTDPAQPLPPMGLPAPYGGLNAPKDLTWPSDDVQTAQVASPTGASYVYGGWGSPVAKDYDLNFGSAGTLAAGWTVYGAMGQDGATTDITTNYIGLSIGDAQKTYGKGTGPDAYLLATVVYLRTASAGAKYRYQTGAGVLGGAQTRFDAWTIPTVPAAVDLTGIGAGYLTAAVTASAVTLAALTLF